MYIVYSYWQSYRKFSTAYSNTSKKSTQTLLYHNKKQDSMP